MRGRGQVCLAFTNFQNFFIFLFFFLSSVTNQEDRRSHRTNGGVVCFLYHQRINVALKAACSGWLAERLVCKKRVWI